MFLYERCHTKLFWNGALIEKEKDVSPTLLYLKYLPLKRLGATPSSSREEVYRSVRISVVISPLLFTEMPFYDIALSKLQRNFATYICNGYFVLTLKCFYHSNVLFSLPFAKMFD
jgi:hypothetical protein